MPSTPRVIVVGAGITGLTAAYRLQQAGVSVSVLDRSDHVGGKTACTRRDGFTLNNGATLLSGSYRALLALVEELGLSHEIVALEPRIGIFGLPEQRVNWISRSRPQVYRDVVRTSIVSAADKVRLARLISDVRAARSSVDYDRPDLQASLDVETVSAYCDRRLSREIERRILAPLMTGLYLIDGSTVSTASMFFSLLKFGGGTLGYRAGIDFICRAITEQVDVTTSARVTSIDRLERGARVKWMVDGVNCEEHVDGVVLAVSPHQVSGLCLSIPTEIATNLNRLPTSTVFSVRLALTRPPCNDGTVIVAPHGALGGIGLITFDHNISPGSVPAGKGLLGVMLSHDWVRTRKFRSDDDIVQELLPQLARAIPDVASLIEFARVTRWDPAGLDGSVGSSRLVAEIAATLDPTDPIQLAGEYLTIPGLEGSVVTANTAAARLIKTFKG